MKALMKTLSALALLAGTATIALADAPVISQINVESEFGAAKTDTAAEAFWPTLQTDLTDAISDRLAQLAGDDGFSVDVSIRELSIDADATKATYRDLNGIDGVVAIRPTKVTTDNSSDDTDRVPVKTFRVHFSVVAPSNGTVLAPDLVLVPPGDAGNYSALIGAVADEIEKQVKDIDM